MNERVYFVEVILYKDNLQHLNLLTTLTNKYDYAYILHDKDLDDNGELKKEHFHLLLFFKNARYFSSILKSIEIDNPQLIQKKKDKRLSIRYLIHADSPNKYQYSLDELHTNIDLSLYFNNNVSRETLEVQILYNYILDNNCSLQSLLYYAINNNLWSTFRRNYSILKDLWVDKINNS